MTREEAILWMQILKHAQINWVGEQAEDEDLIARCEEAEQEAFDMAIEALSEVQKHEETFEWCHDCKEYDTENYCCHRWSKVIRNTVEELKEEPPTIPCFTESAEAYKAWTGEEMGRPHGEWIDVNGDGSLWRCDQCKDTACCKGNFCPNCGARMKGGDDE